MENLEKYQEIVYPITLNYREHWGIWEAIREIVQNSLDSDKDSMKIYKENNNLIIEDKGTGLQVKHLLFGVSEKEDKDNARGKFGEGLKIALIVLKRLGYDTEILSNNLEVIVSTKIIEDQECLKLLYRHNGQEFKGTRIIIKGYIGSDYSENFITSFKDVLFHDNGYGQILRKEENKPSQLFVKDIYVCGLDNAKFSYNLKQVKLEESRNIADEWNLHYQLGYLWSEVTDLELWIKLFRAFKEGNYERKIKFRADISNKTKLIIIKAFNLVFPLSVLKTDSYYSREATWRNREVIDIFDKWDHEELFKILPTDKSFVHGENNKNDIPVNEETLTIKEKENLAIARQLAKRVDNKQLIEVFLMDETNGKAGNPIKLNRKILDNIHQTISTTIHELTHNYYKCDDMTSDMIYKLSDMGASLLIDYIGTEFSTKVLASNIGKYEQQRVSIPKGITKKLNLWKGRKVKVTITKEIE